MDETTGADEPRDGVPPPTRGWQRALNIAITFSAMLFMADVLLSSFFHRWFQGAGLVVAWVLGLPYFAWVWRWIQQRAGDDARSAVRLTWAKRSRGMRVIAVGLIVTWVVGTCWAVALVQSNYAVDGVVACLGLVSIGGLCITLLVGGLIAVIEWLTSGVR